LGVINLVLATLTPLSAVLAAQWALSNGVGLLNLVAGPWWFTLAATFAIRSLAGYGFHVLLHKTPLLWRIHRIHHADTHLDVTTTIRTHPFEFALQFLVMVPLALACGLDPWALAAYELLEAFVNLAAHANLRLPHRLDRTLRWVVVTPNMHCLHHSAYRPETDSNYGQLLSVWDRLFGTYSAAPRGGYDAMLIGLQEPRDDRASDFWWQLRWPALVARDAARDGDPR
jgi:sterol desaturase/sphingolipid hydroxylase (fatty acid hydroxylase superfamily)